MKAIHSMIASLALAFVLPVPAREAHRPKGPPLPTCAEMMAGQGRAHR